MMNDNCLMRFSFNEKRVKYNTVKKLNKNVVLKGIFIKQIFSSTFLSNYSTCNFHTSLETRKIQFTRIHLNVVEPRPEVQLKSRPSISVKYKNYHKFHELIIERGRNNKKILSPHILKIHLLKLKFWFIIPDGQVSFRGLIALSTAPHKPFFNSY